MCAALVALAAASAIPALRARDRLETGRTLLEQARDRLLAGDLPGARSSFGRARQEFALASHAAGSPLVGMWAAMPFVGRTYDAVRNLARIGELTAGAGEDVASAIDDLPGGLSALAPTAGSIRLDAVTSIDRVLASAVDRVRRAEELANGLSRTFVLSQAAEARDEVLGPVEEASEIAMSAHALLRALPAFAGAEGPRRYFVAVQNPAELRGTGGFIGSYSIMTIDDGAMVFAPFRDITRLRDVPSAEIPPPSPEFALLYDEFGGAGYWRNINMSPDTPEVGTAIERLYERVEGVRLDGTIFVDPMALAEMLRATGPIADPQLGIRLSAEDVVPFMTNEAYRRFPSTARKRILGELASRVLDRFLRGRYADPAAAIRALVTAADGGHLVLHAADPEVQRAFRAAGVDGSLSPSGDYLGVFLSNAAGNKVDYYLHERLTYSVTLGEDGSASAEVSILLVNKAPVGRPPDEVLGPYSPDRLETGDTLWWVETLCARTCTLSSAMQDGEPGSVQTLGVSGIPMFRSFAGAAAGGKTTLAYRLDLPHAWTGDGAGGTYRLTIQAQPTIRPVRARIVIRLPEGMGVVDTNEPMRVGGGLVVWSGPVEGRVSLSVEFQRPFFARVWTRLWDLLTTPVIRL
ncbi:MAG: DUF4012 domain-containing protein [Actinomycetota bacterium]